ncbi:MAG: hypothetical protein OXF02_02375 [Simkaniaceae bacterium]|nr:hypothetical protein [Simkaniaceae bacterium]
MGTENVTDSSSQEGVRVTERIPEGVATRAVARRTDGLGERIANYFFGHGPHVGHLAICSAIGGMLGGCVGFGIGVVPGVAIGAVVGAVLVGGLTFAFSVITTRVGYRSGESRDDNGATESDSASTDSGSTDFTEEEEAVFRIGSGLVGGLVGGVVGFGVGLTRGAVVGVFVGAALSDGLALAVLAALHPRAGSGYRPGESRDDNGATESDGASTDSGSTAFTGEEEAVFRMLSEGWSDPELYAGPGLGAQS